MGRPDTLPREEESFPVIAEETSHTRSLLSSCLNGVESVATTTGFVAGRVAGIGLKTSGAVVRGLLS